MLPPKLIWHWAHQFPACLATKNATGRCALRSCTYSTTGSTLPSGLKSTIPSSSRPPMESKHPPLGVDQGYLAFTKASLYKLTLPLAAPTPDSPAPAPEPAEPEELPKPASEVKSDASSSEQQRKEAQAWEQQVEAGHQPVSEAQRALASAQGQGQGQGQAHRENADAHSDQPDTPTPPHSVVFLLHSGQPLSYIAGLIRAEGPSTTPSVQQQKAQGSQKGAAAAGDRDRDRSRQDPDGDPPIGFHTRVGDGKRWSPSTGIGDFLRDAARAGRFAISVGERTIEVNVPSFEERTRFLRGSLHRKTGEIERLAKIKDECDRAARRATQKVALAGAGIMGTWWVSVGFCTFRTSLGWDTMEPITYLTGLGTVISGYLWFLWHNREVSYRTVLTETTSRRQAKLYIARGFNVERYHDLIDEVKELRSAIKRVAWDYDLTWDQGNTDAGKRAKRALQIVRKEENRDAGGRKRHGEEDDEDASDGEEDSDGDGEPDRNAREDQESLRNLWREKDRGVY